jgi:hypothetical protein
MVRCGVDEPALIDTFIVSPAAAAPAKVLMPVVERLAEHRGNLDLPDSVPALGMVVADPGYSAAAAEDWQLPLLTLGASPVFRLHRTNQEPPRWRKVGRGKRAGQVFFVAGRPMCECASHHSSVSTVFPKWPYTDKEVVEYQQQTAKLIPFEWQPNGAANPDGSRQFLAPHTVGPDGVHGGCERCVTAAGERVVVDGVEVPRCCQRRSRVFSRDDLAWVQDDRVGSPDWMEKWNRRAVVEGSYGVMKNRAILDWGRDFHHFVGLARETLAAVFAAVAYNFHMWRSWLAKRRLTHPEEFGADRVRLLRPLYGVTPAAVAEAVEVKPKVVGPRGLEFLSDTGPPG